MLMKLILLDGMALTYRAHFALIRSPRFTSGGLCTSAVFGVLNTLLDIIRREEPTHIAAAFDTSEPTARHLEFEQYKAHREAMISPVSGTASLAAFLFCKSSNFTITPQSRICGISNSGTKM